SAPRRTHPRGHSLLATPSLVLLDRWFSVGHHPPKELEYRIGKTGLIPRSASLRHTTGALKPSAHSPSALTYHTRLRQFDCAPKPPPGPKGSGATRPAHFDCPQSC